MYLPLHFNQRDPAVAARLMREHPFASLITTDDDGLPFVTHLPLHLWERGGEAGQAPAGDPASKFTLLGHVARPNPQWRHLAERPRAVVTFMGPHAYMSPRVYPDLARVPTWNYIAVHCTVTARLLPHDDAEAKDRLLKCLIGDHEPAYAEQWRAMDAELAHKLLQGIVGFELTVTDWQCKAKLNQHRPEARVALHAAYASGTPHERALAEWIERLGFAAPAPASGS